MFMTSGCVPVIYHRPIPLRYESIDTIIIDGRIEQVFIPRYRPRPMYYWDGFWYDEPYTYISYRDLRGNTTPRRIPKRIMKDIDHKVRKAPEKPKQLPQNLPNKDRVRNRRRTQRRK